MSAVFLSEIFTLALNQSLQTISSRLVFDPLQQFSECQVECACDCLHHSQADFLLANFQIGNVVFVDTGFFRKVNLTPASCRPQFADTLTEQDANVPSHSYYRRTRINAAFLLSSELEASESYAFQSCPVYGQRCPSGAVRHTTSHRLRRR